MYIKEISDFMDRTLKQQNSAVNINERNLRERVFWHGMKISEEVGELNEQLLGKFDGQRTTKNHKISDWNLENEIADVILATIRLARLLDLDVEKLLKDKIIILKDRFK